MFALALINFEILQFKMFDLKKSVMVIRCISCNGIIRW